MVERALAAASSPAWRAVVIGDETCDLQLARNAGLASIAVATGHGCRDGRHPAEPTWRFSSLLDAARWLCGARPPDRGEGLPR
jgi:phosphoglycolate phosphatase-like HAD superfamily hydrolase